MVKTIRQRDFRIEQLRGQIVHLDEVLTMSARMAAATGDPQWEVRYLENLPKLHDAIEEAKSVAPEDYGVDMAEQTDIANDRLVDMENQAFELVREGRLEEAQDLLRSEEYETQKRIYAEGMTGFANQLCHASETALHAQQQRAFARIAVAVVATLVLLAGWLLVLRTMRHWRTAILEHNRLLTRQAAEELEQERYLLHTLMETVPDAIYFKDAKSRFLRISKAMAQRFGLKDAAEAVGKSDADFFDEDHATDARRDEEELMRSGQPMVDKEESEVWPDGTKTWASTTKLPLRDRQGNVVGTFGVSRNITERKQATEALREANEQLREAKDEAEAANEAKSTFLANMSHEIRTPLNAIIGMAELVRDSGLTRRQQEFLTVVEESGEALLSLINDILDLSKIEAGKIVAKESVFDLREALGDTVKSLAVRAHMQGLELACRIPPDTPRFVFGDRSWLRQVVVNLVGNAIKFTQQGEVVVVVENESQTDHEVELHFSVADTGIGIPEEKHLLIFEMFEQADKSTTRRYGGTGLGLAISSRLVDLMGGRIWVESREGSGSTFHFTARFKLPDELPDEPELVPVETLRDLPVLVVDDNATNRRILEEILTAWEMRPTVVSSGRQALQEIQRAWESSRPFPLVIADVHMPEMSGFMLAQRVKEHKQLSSTIIMMLTSGDQPGDAQRCEQLGIAAYLMKPIKQSELFDAIRLALGVGAVKEEGPPSPEALPRRLEPLRILLAEDSLVNQKLVVALMERHGHTVVVASNGREALAAFQSWPFDLVLMDVQMPEMDGIEAAAAIRGNERAAGTHVPIIAMTAHVLKGDREQCIAAGMDAYVAKPIRAAPLFDAIEQVLDAGVRRDAQTPDFPESDGALDWSDALEAVQGDRRLLREIVEAYLEESPKLLAEIREAVAGGDAATLSRAAHSLKGSMRHFGAQDGAECAYRLETSGRDGKLDVAVEALAALEREAARLQAVLGDYLKLDGAKEGA